MEPLTLCCSPSCRTIFDAARTRTGRGGSDSAETDLVWDPQMEARRAGGSNKRSGMKTKKQKAVAVASESGNYCSPHNSSCVGFYFKAPSGWMRASKRTYTVATG